MNIDVVATAQQVSESIVKDKTIVVIDVLRATSVMVTALNNDALGVIPVLEPEEAFGVKQEQKHDCILGGERHADLIEGFDFGNSPLAYSEDVIKEKILVMTTTNGTLALNNSLSASELLIGAFINDKAVAKELEEKDNIVLVCSGNNGLYTLEDALCAGRIIDLLMQRNDKIQLTDLALSVHQLYSQNKDDLMKLASKGYHYNVLAGKNYIEDLQYCFKSDICNIVPVWNGTMLVKNQSSI